MDKRKISIVGIGMVGGAIKKYFEGKTNYELFFYDKGKELGSMEDVNKGDYIYICVPTPDVKDVGCDTSIVEWVLDNLVGEKVVVIKSTIVPGTTERLQAKYPQHKILYNPEFLTEITADQDMSFPDRQILGYTEKSYGVAKDVMQQLPLAPFERFIGATEAEMIKYMGNCWFATKVIFANQIFDLCEKLGVNYDTVMDGVAADKRIGRTHLKVWHRGYRGFGNLKVSKCLPKDLKALIALGDEKGVSLQLLKIVDLINEKLWTKYGDEKKVTTDKDTSFTSGGDVVHK